MGRFSIPVLVVTVFMVVGMSLGYVHKDTPKIIQLLRPRFGSGGHPMAGLSCDSWRLAVETNNIINWDVVPRQCENYVGNYMLGGLYRKDSRTVCDIAAEYAEGLNVTSKDIWVFDVDETSLSNIVYYAGYGFGADAFNSTTFDEWVLSAQATALPETLKLYNKLISLGIKIVFITGKGDTYKNATTTNLKSAGYTTWEKLVLKPSSEPSTTSLVYKSTMRKQLEEQEGYTIVGNMGDQWSDLMGSNVGLRTFKLPDPMYYIA